MKWAQLIRINNLLFVGLTHVLFRCSLFPFLNLETKITDAYFTVLSLSILGVTASGNIINDIYDVQTDKLNNRDRPLALGKISTKGAWIAYAIAVVGSLALALVFCLKYHLWWLLLAEVLTIFLLFLYAWRLKQIAVWGNILISSLVSLSFMLLIFVELPLELNSIHIHWIVFFGGFAFWTNLNREIIKDVQDIKGDYSCHYNTLPIAIGRSRTQSVLFVSTSLLVIAISVGIKNYLFAPVDILIYFIFVVCLPLGFVAYRLFRQEQLVNYKHLSLMYKSVMLAGVLSLVFL